ncbi:MAG: hypothetical protein JST06_05060 [Bacteroidetes bacterium]|nr:hypothetical protein [Bacteroidota bacterium]
MTAVLFAWPCFRSVEALHAQTNDLQSFIINDGADYLGYVLTPHRFANIPSPSSIKDGYLAVGNRKAGSVHDKVHLLCIPDSATGVAATGSLLDIFNTSDIRAVAMTPAGASPAGNQANAIVLQARGDQNIAPDHIDVVLIDADDPTHPPLIYNQYRLVDQAGLRLQDITGRTIYSATTHPVGNSAHFELPAVAEGLYLATFTLNGAQAKTVKLNIQP